MSSAFDVVCIGLATADTIVVLPEWPAPDGRVIAEPIVRAGGGPAATAAVAIARQGGSVALIAAVGDDDVGSTVRVDLAAAGVDVEGVTSVPGRTAESVIVVDRSAATRAILHAPGAAVAALDDAARQRSSASRWVHVDHVGYPLVAGVDPGRLSIDAGNPIDGLRLEGVGLYAPTGAALAERYPGRPLQQAARLALDEGARRVVVTLGREGAIAADDTGAWRVAAPDVVASSTLGAGDVFHGVLLASLAAGIPLPEAALHATVAASLSCRAIDARSAIPTSAELDAALADAPALEPILLRPSR